MDGPFGEGDRVPGRPSLEYLFQLALPGILQSSPTIILHPKARILDSYIWTRLDPESSAEINKR